MKRYSAPPPTSPTMVGGVIGGAPGSEAKSGGFGARAGWRQGRAGPLQVEVVARADMFGERAQLAGCAPTLALQAGGGQAGFLGSDGFGAGLDLLGNGVAFLAGGITEGWTLPGPRRPGAPDRPFRRLETEFADFHINRMRSARIERLDSCAIHLDMLRVLNRLNAHLTSVVSLIVEGMGALEKCRVRTAECAQICQRADDWTRARRSNSNPPRQRGKP